MRPGAEGQEVKVIRLWTPDGPAPIVNEEAIKPRSESGALATLVFGSPKSQSGSVTPFSGEASPQRSIFQSAVITGSTASASR